VASVRGRGLLLAVELDELSSAEAAGRLLAGGVLVNAITPTALRLCPPLSLSRREAAQVIDAISAALAVDRKAVLR
jgi:acetylornithine aminotransferase